MSFNSDTDGYSISRCYFSNDRLTHHKMSKYSTFSNYLKAFNFFYIPSHYDEFQCICEVEGHLYFLQRKSKIFYKFSILFLEQPKVSYSLMPKSARLRVNLKSSLCLLLSPPQTVIPSAAAADCQQLYVLVCSFSVCSSMPDESLG